MKREIKFKVWDLQKKCWYEPIFEAYKGRLSDLMIGLSGNLFEHTMNGVAHESTFPDRFELMQFTGLPDKNSKEIYKGDVLNLKTTFDNNMADKRFQPATQVNVGFENGCFIDKNTGRTLFDAIRTISSYSQNKWTNYEIIGNEFENPELI
jgi:uncharacterized phage protein (TIGR01671 family)